jgi:hypothetical protein
VTSVSCSPARINCRTRMWPEESRSHPLVESLSIARPRAGANYARVGPQRMAGFRNDQHRLGAGVETRRARAAQRRNCGAPAWPRRTARDRSPQRSMRYGVPEGRPSPAEQTGAAPRECAYPPVCPPTQAKSHRAFPSCNPRTASLPSLKATSAASACGKKARPAPVSFALPRMRSNLDAPSACSNIPSRRLMAGCVRCRRSPARVKLPSSAMATNVLMSSMFIDQEAQILCI